MFEDKILQSDNSSCGLFVCYFFNALSNDRDDKLREKFDSWDKT